MSDSKPENKNGKNLVKRGKQDASNINKQDHLYHLSKNAEIQNDNNRLQKQLPLFTIENSDNSPKGGYELSNAIDIWDVIPKYSADDSIAVQVGELKNPVITNETSIYGQVYKTSIVPAQLLKSETQSGEIEWRFPTRREMYVEEALMKIAVSGSVNADTKFAGVKFTLYELLEELKRTKHTLSFRQLKESLMICHRTRIEVATEDGRNIVSATIFPMIGLTSKEDYFSNLNADATCYVQFNPLVTVSIQTLTFRQYNYTKSMSLTRALSNILYKRLVLHWTQASPNHPYTFLMSNLLENSSRQAVKNSQTDRRLMYSTINQLKEQKILKKDHNEIIIREGRKIVDIKFSVYPHAEFVDEVIQANIAQKEKREMLNKELCIEQMRKLTKPR